ncbi:MAG: zf-HC2 domain-containing protein [Elusimicrobiota bacterium]
MNDEHVANLLSAYFDDALDAGERVRVDKHLPQCAACRRELDELKRVSKSVSALPREDLPAGFLQRLHNKRRETEREASRPTAWLPAPARLAAFAAAGLLAALIFFREVKYRLAPMMLPEAAQASKGLDAAPDEAEIEAARRRMVEGRVWRGLAEEAPSDMEGDKRYPQGSGLADVGAGAAAAGPSPEAILRSGLKGLGAPHKGRDGKPTNIYTNEDLHAMLEKEKKRMGIRKIIPQSSQPGDPWQGVPDRPLSGDEAKVAMRRMTSQLSRINRATRARNAPTVALGPGDTPKLLSAADESRPVAPTAVSALEPELAPAAAAPQTPVRLAKMRAARRAAPAPKEDAELGGSVGMVRKEPLPPAARAAGADAAREYFAQHYSIEDLKKRLAEENTADMAPNPLSIRSGWSSAEGGLGAPGGAVITTPDDWADLWHRIGGEESRPDVNFDREMALAVFGERSNEERRTIEIVSVLERGERLEIHYRLGAEEGAPGPSAPYHVVIVPRSDLPPNFVQVP